MNSKKLIEIRPQGPGLFMRYLKFLSQQKEWNWEFECHEEFTPEIIKQATAVKVECSLSELVLPQTKVIPTQVRMLEALDSLFQENGNWYPRLIFYETLRLVLVREATELDIRNPVFVVGGNKDARVVVSVLAEIGFSEFYLVGEPDELNQEKDFLLHRQWGLHIHVLPPEDLTMQALSAGIVINTLDLSANKDLLLDLSYFNFMKQGGYVLDLSPAMGFNLFLDEAEKAGLKVLSSQLVMQVEARLWLERLNANITDEEIQNSCSLFLKEISSSV